MDRTGDHGRRLSDAERLEIQRRVGAGETFAGVAAAVGCSTKSIQRLFVRTGGLAPRTPVRSPLRLSLAEREEISRDWGRGTRVERSPGASGGRPRRCRARLLRRGAAPGTGRGGPSGGPSAKPAGRKRRSWPAIRDCAPRSSAGWRSGGPRSRSRIASRSIILMIERCTCLTRRSIDPCLCRRAGRSARSSRRACARAAPSAVPRRD